VAQPRCAECQRRARRCHFSIASATSACTVGAVLLAGATEVLATSLAVTHANGASLWKRTVRGRHSLTSNTVRRRTARCPCPGRRRSRRAPPRPGRGRGTGSTAGRRTAGGRRPGRTRRPGPRRWRCVGHTHGRGRLGRPQAAYGRPCISSTGSRRVFATRFQQVAAMRPPGHLRQQHVARVAVEARDQEHALAPIWHAEACARTSFWD